MIDERLRFLGKYVLSKDLQNIFKISKGPSYSNKRCKNLNFLTLHCMNAKGEPIKLFYLKNGM